MNLPTREECEGWDHMKVALFMCKNNMQDCAGTVTRLKIDGLRLLNLTENDIRKFSLLQQPQLQKMVQDIKKNDGSLLNKIRRLKNKPRPNVPARDYRDFRDSDQCSDPEYNEPCDDPPDDDSYEPPPVHREFTRSPFISLPKGEYLDSSHAGPSRPPKKPIRPVKASKQLPPEPPHPWSDKEEDYVDPDANGEDDYIEPTENPSPKGGNRGDYPILPPALPDRPSSPEDLYEEPEKEEPSTSPQRNRFRPPPSKPGLSLPKPTPRLNKWGHTRPIQQPTDDDEYELCDDSPSHEPPGGPPPRLPKPVQRERSPKPPLLPRQDIKPRQFDTSASPPLNTPYRDKFQDVCIFKGTSLPVMHTEQKPSPKAFSLDLKRPKIPLPQFTPPKPAERGCIAAENGSTDQDKDADVYHKPWFANGCDRKTADDALLRSNKDGAFMVRKSSGQDVQQPYTLVVFYKGRVYNIPIRFVPSTKQYALGREKKGEEFFSSVSSIIENHQRNLLVLIDSQSNSKDATKLFFPVRP